MRRSGHGPLSSPAAASRSSTQARTARDPDAPRCPAGSELPRTPGHRSPVPGLFEVVVKAGQRDGAPYGLRRDSGPDAPPPHEQALVYQLLYRRAHGGTADPQPPREIRLALQRAPPSRRPSSIASSRSRAALMIQRHRAAVVERRPRQSVQFEHSPTLSITTPVMQ
jgi:hypothetical protein